MACHINTILHLIVVLPRKEGDAIVGLIELIEHVVELIVKPARCHMVAEEVSTSISGQQGRAWTLPG